MKPTTFRLLGTFSFLGLLVIAVLAVQMNATGSESADPDKKKLRHVVMFGFKESSTQEQVQAVVDAFAKLPSQIPAIADFEFGRNNSPEGLNDGLTHCFLVTFQSEADRDAYLPHPEHLAFVEVLKPHLEKVVVLDYWTQ